MTSGSLIGEALFSTELTASAPEIGTALAVAFAHAKASMYNPLQWPEWVPTKRNRALRRARHTLRGIVSAVLDRAGENPDRAPDLLAILAGRGCAAGLRGSRTALDQ